MSEASRKKGRQQLAAAKEAHLKSEHSSASASGVILHRKDHMVLNGTFKWIPCEWAFRGNTLVLTPYMSGKTAEGADDASPKARVENEETFEIREDSQYTKPKGKHYPIQFGSESVHSSVLLEKVTYAPTGYAPSALNPLHRPGSEDMRAVCKLGALDVADLEKILSCIQAVVEGKSPAAYL